MLWLPLGHTTPELRVAPQVPNSKHVDLIVQNCIEKTVGESRHRPAPRFADKWQAPFGILRYLRDRPLSLIEKLVAQR